VAGAVLEPLEEVLVEAIHDLSSFAPPAVL
jgi:hypothetical protein